MLTLLLVFVYKSLRFPFPPIGPLFFHQNPIMKAILPIEALESFTIPAGADAIAAELTNEKDRFQGENKGILP